MPETSATISEYEQISPTTFHVAIKVPSDKIVHELDKMYNDLAAKAIIPGFRPGKAPKNIIDRTYGKDQILAETYENVIESTIWPALKEKEITIVGRPRIDFSPWTRGEDFAYRAVFEIVPPISQIDYESITAILPIREITDENMAEELRKLSIRLGTSERISDRPVKNGDLVLASFEGEVPEVTISSLEGDHPWRFTNPTLEIEVGIGKPVKGLDEHIMGMELEEIKECEFILPDDFDDHQVRGKNIKAKVHILGIMKITPLELSDENIKSKFGDHGIETLDALKEKIRGEMEIELTRAEGREKADQVEVYLSRRDDFPLPENLVRSKFAELIDRIMESMKSDDKDTEFVLKEDDEKGVAIRKRARFQAERMVRLDLLTREIARKESIGVNNEEVANYIMMMGMQQGVQEKDIRTLIQDQNFVDGTRNDILRRKVTSFLISKMMVEKVPEQDYREHVDKTRDEELARETETLKKIEDPFITFEIDYLTETLNKIVQRNKEKTAEISEEAPVVISGDSGELKDQA
ncbi:MAG: trigger factor [bacterium]|nr:trigger factor [bacterium]